MRKMLRRTLTTIKKRYFRRIFGAPRRLARRRGFGIHSPFAFDFVRRVIAQPCSYYCYPMLDELAKTENVKTSVVRLIFRVALFFRPSQVKYLGVCPVSVVKAVEAACPEPMKSRGPVLSIISAPVSSIDFDEVIQSVRKGYVMIFLNLKKDSSASKAAWAAAEHGMMFRGSDTSIYVGLQHLPRQSYKVWL